MRPSNRILILVLALLALAATGCHSYSLSDEGELLHGNGVLGATSGSGVSADPDTTSLFEAREWLQVTANAAGTEAVTLKAAGNSLGTFAVTGVDDAQVAELQLDRQSESD